MTLESHADAMSAPILRQQYPTTKDMTGLVFGRLTILGWAGSDKNRKAIWHARCECGVQKTVSGLLLRNGHTRSCGCMEAETRVANMRGASERRQSHGMTQASEFNIYHRMVQRCQNPNDPAYVNYGGRGIVVCDRWLDSFENFFADMGARPGKELTLDRRDNNGPYSPENCRWADRETQANNRRGLRLIAFKGVTMSVSQWARQVGLPANALRQRLSSGTPIAEALSRPLKVSTRSRS